MTDRTRLPLPEPAMVEENPYGEPGICEWYDADQMHAYADAENAALRERVKVLEDAIQHYESALRDAWPEGAKGASWEFWNRARIVALEATR